MMQYLYEFKKNKIKRNIVYPSLLHDLKGQITRLLQA